jgi:hypothetical protein
MNSEVSEEDIIFKKSQTYQYSNREGLPVETLQVKRAKCESATLRGSEWGRVFTDTV